MLKIGNRLTIIASFVLVATAAACSLAAPPEEKQTQFFAGVFLLQSTTDLTAEKRAELFRELETLTGIKTATALKLLSYYRKKPAEWQHVYAAMNALLTKVHASPPLPSTGRETHAKIY